MGAAACPAGADVSADLKRLQQLQRLNCHHLQVWHDHPCKEKLRRHQEYVRRGLFTCALSHQVQKLSVIHCAVLANKCMASSQDASLKSSKPLWLSQLA